MKFVSAVIFLFGLAQIAYADEDTSAVATIKKSVACFEAMMSYSNGLGSGTDKLEKLCAIGQSNNTLWRQRTYDELNYWRNLALPLDEEDQHRCEIWWSKAWKAVEEEMTRRIKGSRVIKSILPGTTENIPNWLSLVEFELFFRSAMEQEMTRNSTERGENTEVLNNSCLHPQKAMTLARLENVLYFDEQHVFDKRDNDAWPREINLRLWLVAQHADFFPGFQKQGLAYFEALGTARALSDRYVTMLKNRILDNSKADWYQKFALEEKAADSHDK